MPVAPPVLARVPITVKGTSLTVEGPDPVVYHVTDPDHASPDRPHEVCWEVTGLSANQTVEIVDPGWGDYLFPRVAPTLVMSPTLPSGTSGPPKRGPAQGQSTWKYDVVLKEAGVVKERLDPTVIIKDDP